MTLRVLPVLALAFVALSLNEVSASAQQEVVIKGGPPPAIRELIDGVVEGVNRGDAAAWEAFAQARFSPALLQKQTRDERAQRYSQIVGSFGTITLEDVMRRGPDAPLELNVTGSKGAGVIIVGLDEGPPPRIASFGAKVGERARAGSGSGPRPPVNGKMAPDEIARQLDGFFTKLAADEVFSGVALAAKNGEPVFFKAYGYADREKKIANTTRTRFNLGSINKAFTQVAVRQLIREGKLSLTDTLGKFFPDYPQAASRAATVDQLLNHRAGIADFFGPQFNAAPKSQFASNADYFKLVSSLPPLFAPGERNQYCNGCYITLGAIVEKVSGMPYEKYVADNIFSRAEMTSTGYPRTDKPEAGIALGYTRLRQGYGGQAREASQALKPSSPQALVSNINMHGVSGSAAGGGYSTALDLLSYVKAVRAGRIPDGNAGMAIAGGAPGINAVVESAGDWVVIVLTNFDPPTGEEIGAALAGALAR
jgi:CubicO group peptidase (beta-lactamase class C family)